MEGEERNTEIVEPLSLRYRRWVGPGAEERHPPSLPVALAGAGAVVAAFALTALGAEAVEDGSYGLAVVAAAGFAVAGVALVRLAQPLRTAGIVAVAAGAALAIAFLVLGNGSYSRSEPTIVMALSTVVWGGLHFAGPTKGSPFLLGATLVGVWATLVFQVGVDGLFFSPFVVTEIGPFFAPDTAEVVIVSVGLGALYLLCADSLDHAGLRGTATVFAGVGLLTLGTGVWAGAIGRESWVAGLLLTLAGALAAVFGARRGRRLSTWLGAGAVAVGLVVLTSELAGEEDVQTTGPLVGLLTSAAVVALTPWVARLLGEAPAAPGANAANDDLEPMADA